jgi:DNA-binding transcriptional MerR regulator
MDQARYLIEDLCKLTGFSRRTVRYYVQEGLVNPPAGRGRGGYYSDLHAAQLARIRELQDQGYRLDAIRGMIASPSAAYTTDAVRAPAPAPDRSEVSGSAWTRHVVAPGVELHVSAEAASQRGSVIAAALEELRSIIHHEGGLHE